VKDLNCNSPLASAADYRCDAHMKIDKLDIDYLRLDIFYIVLSGWGTESENNLSLVDLVFMRRMWSGRVRMF
jgi:hypothetical protein